MVIEYSVQNNFNGGILSPDLDAMTNLAQYNTSLKKSTNFLPLMSGVLRKRPGTVFISYLKEVENYGAFLLPYSYDENNHYILEIGHYYIRFFYNQAPLEVSGVPYEITTPFSLDAITDLKHTVYHRDLIFTDGNDYPYLLKRNSHTDWELNLFPLDGPYNPRTEGLSIVWIDGSGEEGTTSTFVSGLHIFHPSDVGRTIQTFSGDLRQEEEIVDDNRYSSFMITQVTDPTHATGRWIRKGSYWALNAWSATANFSVFGPVMEKNGSAHDKVIGAGFPSVLTFFENRFVLGATHDYPMSIWGSNLSINSEAEGYKSYNSFYRFVKEAQQPNDLAYTYTFTSDYVSKIQWMVELSGVLGIGTTKDEWTLGTMDNAEPTTPNSIRSKRTSGYTSSPIGAVLFGDLILFCSRSKTQLYSWQYDNRTFSYVGTSLNRLSQSLLAHGATDMAASRDTEERLYVTDNNGDLLCVVFVPAEKIVGWTKIVTDGKFLSVAAVDTVLNADFNNEIWAIVERENANGVFKSVEMFENEYNSIDNLKAYADCCIKYDGPLTHAVSGLSHLDGRTVSILADGKVYPSQLVEGGAITLNEAAAQIIVGLPYAAYIETLNIEPMVMKASVSPTRSSVGLKRRINNIRINFFDTLNAKVGTSFSNLHIIPFRDSTQRTYGRMPLFTGVKEIQVEDTMDYNSSIIVLSHSPTPMNIKTIGLDLIV